MTALLIAAATTALMGTPHCLGMCGGLASAASEGGVLPYHLGRVGVYALLGAIAGAAGRWIPGPSWVTTVISVALLVAMAASLGGWLGEPKVHVPGLSRLAGVLRGRRGPLASLGLGVLNGLLPCGLLYGTLALPVAAGDAWSGAAVMTAFGVVTALPLTFAAGSLRKLVQARPATRQLLALFVLLSGLGGLMMRVPSGESEVPHCHTP